MNLLACPFCGRDPSVDLLHGAAVVECPRCEVDMREENNAEGLCRLERRWNTRVCGPVTDTVGAEWMEEDRG